MKNKKLSHNGLQGSVTSVMAALLCILIGLAVGFLVLLAINPAHAWADGFVRILKENLLWVRSFRTVEELRLALLAFKETYNRRWRIGRHGYRSPAQVRERQKVEVARAA